MNESVLTVTSGIFTGSGTLTNDGSLVINSDLNMGNVFVYPYIHQRKLTSSPSLLYSSLDHLHLPISFCIFENILERTLET